MSSGGGIGKIFGTAVGAVVGGPAGAAIGGGIGGAVGGSFDGDERSEEDMGGGERYGSMPPAAAPVATGTTMDVAQPSASSTFMNNPEVWKIAASGIGGLASGWAQGEREDEKREDRFRMQFWPGAFYGRTAKPGAYNSMVEQYMGV